MGQKFACVEVHPIKNLRNKGKTTKMYEKQCSYETMHISLVEIYYNGPSIILLRVVGLGKNKSKQRSNKFIKICYILNNS